MSNPKVFFYLFSKYYHYITLMHMLWLASLSVSSKKWYFIILYLASYYVIFYHNGHHKKMHFVSIIALLTDTFNKYCIIGHQVLHQNIEFWKIIIFNYFMYILQSLHSMKSDFKKVFDICINPFSNLLVWYILWGCWER